jgi:4a-hydroxytetrahydrobiopterin dehydratase
VTSRNFEICIDANDPGLLRAFWRATLGYIDEQTGEGANGLVDPQGVRPTVWFQKVPESKISKNRVHLDIRVPLDERDRITGELVALGGTVVAVHARLTTMVDPEGNELCLVAH